MKYISTLLCVKDIEKAKEFYKTLLGLDVINDFGDNVTLRGGISLQTLGTWKEFIDKKEEEIIIKNNATEIYFEENDIEKFYEKLRNRKDIEYIHELKEHSWGQRVIRFYDLDKHIIEVGESLIEVIKRFLRMGLTMEETAKRMDVSIEFIEKSLNRAC